MWLGEILGGLGQNRSSNPGQDDSICMRYVTYIKMIRHIYSNHGCEYLLIMVFYEILFTVVVDTLMGLVLALYLILLEMHE